MKTSFIYNFSCFQLISDSASPAKSVSSIFGLNLPIIVLKSGSFGIFCQVYDVFYV